MNADRKYLDALVRLVATKNQVIPAWLEDLLLLGPRFEEWKLGGLKPNRMFLTEMLARWSKYAGLSEEECLEWLMPYCCELLALTSKSCPSAIRHGTKANTRWVYKSAFPFDFEAMVREMPQPAEPMPAYMPVFAHWWDLLEKAKQHARDSYVPPVFLPVLPVKQRHREAFAKGLAFARAKEAEGETFTRIVELLNAEGLPTITGRKWSLTNLIRALREVPPPSEPPPPT